MSKIVTNSGSASITITTPSGAFVFGAKATVELADERAAEVQKAGKCYFTSGELSIANGATPTAADAEAEAKADAEAEAKADAEAKAKADADTEAAKGKK